MVRPADLKVWIVAGKKIGGKAGKLLLLWISTDFAPSSAWFGRVSIYEFKFVSYATGKTE
jgi:hypothetical protein